MRESRRSSPPPCMREGPRIFFKEESLPTTCPTCWQIKVSNTIANTNRNTNTPLCMRKGPRASPHLHGGGVASFNHSTCWSQVLANNKNKASTLFRNDPLYEIKTVHIPGSLWKKYHMSHLQTNKDRTTITSKRYKMPSSCQLPEEMKLLKNSRRPFHLLQGFAKAPAGWDPLSAGGSYPVFPSGAPIRSVASGQFSLLLLFGHFNFLFPCPST